MTLIVAKKVGGIPKIGSDGISNAGGYITSQESKLYRGKNFIIGGTGDSGLCDIVGDRVNEFKEINCKRDVRDFRDRFLEIFEKNNMFKGEKFYDYAGIIITKDKIFNFDVYGSVDEGDSFAAGVNDQAAEIMMREGSSPEEVMNIIAKNNLSIRPPFYFLTV